MGHTIPYRTIPYHAIPYHTIPYHTIPQHFRPKFFYPPKYSGDHKLFGLKIFFGPKIFLDQKIEQQESSPKFFSIDKLLFTLGKGENQSLILDICPGNICPEYHKL